MNITRGSNQVYIEAAKISETRMFWLIDGEFKINDDFDFNYEVSEWDQTYVHVFKQNNGYYGGLYLFPKNYKITNKEAEYNFFINRKEIDQVVGYYPPFDIIVINFNDSKSNENYEKLKSRFSHTKQVYEVRDMHQAHVEAAKISKTRMFWLIDSEFKINDDFDFEYKIPEWDQKYVHVFKQNNGYYGGLYLFPKNYKITNKEAEYNFFVNTKEIDQVVGYYPPFDIVFISYNEPNADENYEKLKSRFPHVKRIHGVKGIHQAHVEAAKISETRMFWVVDGDAIIDSDFNFELEVNQWSRNTVYVHQSKNPINDLVYGYGGVKFLPKELVLSMDINSVDMTTSISKRFNSVQKVSNITSFNTDPFSTWKSAFRECVKLSSRIIEGQVDNQTQRRLDIWCSVGEDRQYGEYSIKGAIAGKEFGIKYAEDTDMLKKINDWEWLQNEFRK